jgi:hypothetical protein
MGLQQLDLIHQKNFGERIWRRVAFLGRYAHQPADVSLSLSADDLQRLVTATATLLEEEHKKD